MRDSFLTSLKIGGAPASLIMKVLRRCGQLIGETLDCIEKRIAFVRKFVEENGYALDTPIPPAFVDRALGFSCGIPQQSSTFRVPSGYPADSDTLSHLAAFARAASALEEAHFRLIRKVEGTGTRFMQG